MDKMHDMRIGGEWICPNCKTTNVVGVLKCRKCGKSSLEKKNG